MKARFSTLISAIATYPLLSVGIIAVIGASAVGIVYLSTLQQPNNTYVTVVRAPIVAQVDSIATVKASESIGLAFNIPGRVAQVNVPAGTHVAAGTVIATLDTASINAARAIAQGNLDTQIARLSELQSGTRKEVLTISQTTVNGAASILKNAEQAQRNAVRSAYVNANNAIHNNVDQFFINPRVASVRLSFTVPNEVLKNTIRQERIAIEPILTSWHKVIYAPSFSIATDTDTLSASARTNLTLISLFLSHISKALSITPTSATLPLTTLRGYQESVAVAQNAVSNAFSMLTGADTAKRSAQTELTSAQEQLALEQSGATTHTIQAQEAQVAVAHAALSAAIATESNAVIRAPVAGTITKQNAHVGQTVLPGMALVSFISDGKFEVDTYVSQMKLVKIKRGDAVQATLIAYRHTAPLKAIITEVSHSPTIRNGIASYKVTATFVNADPRIKEGLTASLRIITKQINKALVVPTSAVIQNGNRSFVLLRTAKGGIQQVAVTTGITSMNGMIQILSGLSVGARIESFGGVIQQ